MGFVLDPKPIVFIALYILIIMLYYLLVIRRKKNNYSITQILITFAFILYWICVFKVSMLPIEILNEDLSQYSHRYYQLIPFKTIKQVISVSTWKVQILGNIAFLFPLPIFCSFFKDGKFSFVNAVKITFITSLTIETIQLMINFATKVPNKVADIDDLILNVLGGILGWLVFRLVFKLKPSLFASQASINQEK